MPGISVLATNLYDVLPSAPETKTDRSSCFSSFALFVEEREGLPRVSRYRAQLRERQTHLSDIGLAQIRFEEQQRDLARFSRAVDAAIVEAAEDPISDEELETIRPEVEKLLKDRRDLLQQVGDTYTSYLRILWELDVAQRRLLDATQEYREFLDRHLLWIPSAPIVGLQAIDNVPAALAWALSPQSWGSAASETCPAPT